ncbi:MAG: hypothetical protein EXX96DRAFT_64714 [Benjaminiella poitrasii]|nr:MAG: hypothetical protein EXX96DRAFT_64714 [Benjaminiella poitrasii]
MLKRLVRQHGKATTCPSSRALTMTTIRPLMRHYITTTNRSASVGDRRTIRVPPLALILIGTGLGCLGVGLYEHYMSDIQKLPAPVRQALRKGLYYQHRHDLGLAVKYFREALELATDELDSAPLTGIMIQLGSLEEEKGELVEARQTLMRAVRHLVGRDETRPDLLLASLDSLSPPVQRKVVGIAQKLGDIASAMHRDEEAEAWYVASVEHLLRSAARPLSDYGDTADVVFDEEHMPDWLSKTDVGAALEALGGFYAARNKPSLAIHLYLRALSLNGIKSCQSAVMMNNLAESYSSMDQLEEAKIWAQRGLDLAQNPNTGKVNKDGELCDETCGVLLFNMGMLFE